MSGTRSKAAVALFRIIRTAWSAWNPTSFAVTGWSAPRGIVVWPGVTSMLYGAAASTLREITSSADSACRM